MKIKINSLTDLDIEQIKISGVLTIAGKKLSAGINKTLDKTIISQLPPSLIDSLTSYIFGEDYSEDELNALSESLEEIIKQKSENEE